MGTRADASGTPLGGDQMRHVGEMQGLPTCNPDGTVSTFRALRLDQLPVRRANHAGEDSTYRERNGAALA